MKKIGCGVIGLGRAGLNHAKVYAQLPHVELVAVCDVDKRLLSEVSNRLGVEAYDDIDEFLADKRIQAVSLVVPDHLHLAPLRKLVAAGKHILIEKPLAASLDEAVAAADLVSGYEQVVGVAHLLRFDPRFSETKRVIASGELGDLLSMSFRRNSSLLGGQHYGRFADVNFHVMVHDLDIAEWFASARPRTVYARSRSLRLKDVGAEDVVFATVEYDNGVLATFEACWALPQNIPFELHDAAEVIGTDGVAYIDSCAHGVSIVASDRIMAPDSRHWPDINGRVGGALQLEITEFMDCVIDLRPFPVGVDASLSTVKVAAAISESTKSRREVTIE